MEFIAVVIAVSLVQLWGSGAPLHRDGWYITFCRALGRLPILNSPIIFSPATVLMLACISLPVFAVLVVYYGVADQWWGLPKLMLLVLLLLYSLGRGDFRAQCENYAQVWRRGDSDAALNMLQVFDGANVAPVESPQQLHALACERILYRGFERMFAVLFWFMLAGPALAVAYRLAFIYRQKIMSRDHIVTDHAEAITQVELLLALMEWLPARVLGLSFALVANIAEGLRTWISTALMHALSARAYLYAAGCGVLGLDAMNIAPLANELTDVADDELKQIQVLLNRCLVLWLVVFALLQLVN